MTPTTELVRHQHRGSPGRVFALALAVAIAVMALGTSPARACTMIALGKRATRDGSTIVSHTDDAGGDTGDLRLVRVPARNHSHGSWRAVHRYAGGFPRVVLGSDGDKRADAYAPAPGQAPSMPLGFIEQVAYTHGYLEQDYGIMNDVQLSIAESTCNAKTFGWSSDRPHGRNLFSIGELTRVALERCDSARCAVQLMGDLAVAHGFYGDYSGTPENPGHSSSEALGVADKYGEVWIFHVLTGPGNASAVWAAQRLEDDHVTVIPNDFIIQGIDVNDPSRFLASTNVFSFAQDMGWWDPALGPFNFKKAYAYDPTADEPGPKLYLDGRVWRVFDRFAPSLHLGSPLGYVHEKPSFPFSVPVDARVRVEQVMDMLRDHYEGTPYDMTKGVAAGPFGNPVRYSGVMPAMRGGWQRAISLHRTLFSFVLQSRGNLPDALGGITWFGQSAPHGAVYVPFSGAQRSIPDSYSVLAGKQSQFSTASAWWAFDFVNNWSSLRYDSISVDVKAEIARLQTEALQRQSQFTAEFADEEDTNRIVSILERENNQFANRVVADWWSLAWQLVSKYSDGYVTTGESEGEMQSPGYPASWVALTEFAAWPVVDAPPVAAAVMKGAVDFGVTFDGNNDASSTSSLLLASVLSLGVAAGVACTLLAVRLQQTWRRRAAYSRI